MIAATHPDAMKRQKWNPVPFREPAGGRETLGLEAECAHPGHINAPAVHRPSHLSDQ